MGIESTKYGTYRVRWSEPDGSGQVARSFKTMAEAEAFEAVVTRIIKGGQPVGRIRAKVLVDDDESRLRVSSRGHHVYLLHDKDDNVIYVGRSSNVLKRIGDHLHVRGRRDLVAGVTIIRCVDEDEMKHLEMVLIYQHKPELNIRGIKGRPRRTTRSWVPEASEPLTVA